MVQYLGIAMLGLWTRPQNIYVNALVPSPCGRRWRSPALSSPEIDTMLKMEIQAADAITFLEAEAFKGWGWQEWV